MRAQNWTFNVLHRADSRPRGATVVGPARASTVEAALHLAQVPETIRDQIRTCDVVRRFVDGQLDSDPVKRYYHDQQYEDGSYVYVSEDQVPLWVVRIESVQEVLF
jgi:hypothetical protein